MKQSSFGSAGRRLIALTSYGYQAVSALALVLLVGRLLRDAEYARFSLTLATSQFAAIGAFEWVRLAATRFYPGPDANRTPIQLASLVAAFGGSAGLGSIAAIVALLLGAPNDVVIVGALIALSQGATDLQLTLCRFRGDLALFSRGQTLRATLLLVGGVSGAALSHSALGALAGVFAGQLIALVVAFSSDAPLRSTPWRQACKAMVQAQIGYGAPAAAASVLHLGAALAARYIVSILAPGVAGASALMAFDLMQRPFSVVTAAMHGVLYPPVVADYDKGGFAQAKASLRRLYTLETTCICILAVAIAVAVLYPPIIALIVPVAFRPSFTMPALLAVAVFAARSILVNLAPLAAHLARRVPLIVATALCDAVLFAAFLGVAFQIGNRSAGATIGAFALSSMTTIGIGAYISLRLFRREHQPQ